MFLWILLMVFPWTFCQAVSQAINTAYLTSMYQNGQVSRLNPFLKRAAALEPKRAGHLRLLLKEGLERLFGLYLPVDFATVPFGSSREEIIAEIGSFFFHNPFRWYLPAFVIGAWIIELALFTAAKVPAAMRAGILPVDFAIHINRLSAKNALHIIPQLNLSSWIGTQDTPVSIPALRRRQTRFDALKSDLARTILFWHSWYSPVKYFLWLMSHEERPSAAQWEGRPARI